MATTRSGSDRKTAETATSLQKLGPIEIIATVSERGCHGINPHKEQFRALEPILKEIGTVKHLTHPESRLAFAAHRARQAGKIPIHLAFGPPHDIYLTPTVPTAVIPLWGFPDIPTTDLSTNTRNNWARIVSSADALIVSESATADSFCAAGVRTPIHVLGTLVEPEFAEIPDPTDASVSITCRHESRGGPRMKAVVAEPAAPLEMPQNLKPHAAHHVYARALPGRAKRLAVRTVKTGYDRLLRRWLSQEAHDRLKGLKRSLLRQSIATVAIVEHPAHPPLPEASRLQLRGLTFLAEVNYADHGTNDIDLVTAFLIAFRNQPNVTLVITLATTPEREPHDLWRIQHHYEMLKITHDCRIVMISETLDLNSRMELFRGSHYVIDTRRSAREAWFVGRALAAGRPVIAPTHSALTACVSEKTGFVVRSSDEPAAWPHHPEGRRESLAHRLDWADLRNQLVKAGSLSPTDYRTLSASARAHHEANASCSALAKQWRSLLETIAINATNSIEWAS